MPEAPEHEGYVAARVRRTAVMQLREQRVFLEEGPDGWYTGTSSLAIDEHKDGWRAACECGWFGEVFYSARPSDDGIEPAEVEDACEAQWHEHMAPVVALGDIAAAQQRVEDARHDLDGAVDRARGFGRSWAEIGSAAGMTRQAARERWG